MPIESFNNNACYYLLTMCMYAHPCIYSSHAHARMHLHDLCIQLRSLCYTYGTHLTYVQMYIHPWNRNPRPQPQKFSQLVFPI